MSTQVAIEHRTTYAFARPVGVGPHVVRLRPAPHCRTPIDAYSLTVSPAEHHLDWQQDPFGNWLARLVFPSPVSTLEVTVGLVADLVAVNPFDFFVETYAQTHPFAYEPQLAADLAPYLHPVEGTEALTAWRERLPAPPAGGTPTVQLLAELNAAVHRDVAYSVRTEAGVQSPDETLARGIGSCRDSAWLLVGLLRQHGLAARFVSGYLVQLGDDAGPLDGASGDGASGDGASGDGASGEGDGVPPGERHGDVTDLHAWAEAFVPGAGWIGLDPTSSLFAGEGHIPLSATPHPRSAAPVEGATEPVEVTFSFHHEVRRIGADPTPSRPYSAQAWSRVDALGAAVDARLEAGGLRVDTGGEVVFAALGGGPPEAERAADLAERLRPTYAEGGVVLRDPGRVRPGDPQPDRAGWGTALLRRTDGAELWHDPALLAGPADPTADAPADPAADAPADPAAETTAGHAATRDAEALARRVAAVLGLPAEQLHPAHEPGSTGPATDPATDLATDLATDPATDPTAEGVPAGWVLPLVARAGGWVSPAWDLPGGRLLLTPGPGAVGLRLPRAVARPEETRGTGPTGETGVPTYPAVPLSPSVPAASVVDPAGEATTALVVEAHAGRVHVLLPPTERVEDLVDLLRLVEVAARRVGCAVVLEGHAPPPDPRLGVLRLTPGPGVVAVDLPPATTWAGLSATTTTVHEEAARAGLSAETFDLDGTRRGTGRGHLTLDWTPAVTPGATPDPTPGAGGRADGPLQARPDLLAGLVAYWQRHPSLSYVFSGPFVGPDGPAPRFDEGRPEAVGEMEIALAEIARAAGLPADLVDRALRPLLVQPGADPDRAELLLARPGALTLRGLVTPPHSRLALVQALLVRGLVAVLAERPRPEPLVRWGTALHDDHLLPQGAARDLAAVAADLRAAGLAFEETWLDPFLEHRFPLLGATVVPTAQGPVELELRAGLEPWRVVPEESVGGTLHWVDSSLARLQVTVRGIDPRRHLLTCQGVPVPLTTTGTPGEHYAGVRYRARPQRAALHPTIAVHAPLHVELVDVDAEVSLGGATHHVVHPGGRSDAAVPVGAQEAEARRASRFEPRGHTPGRLDVAAAREAARRAATPDLPHTLDLRRVRLGPAPSGS